MSRVTLKDVAARAGVSYQTVSKVLNKQAQVAPETEERIWNAVAELGYRPNISARNLRTQATNLIGYGWTHSPGSYFHPVLDRFLHSVAYAAESLGYHLLTFLVPEHDHTNLSAYMELFARGQVDGFILANTIQDDPRIANLIEEQIPFASFGQANDEWDFCWVDVDGRHGIQLAMDHLLGAGHRRVAFISWPEGSQSGYHREQGYLSRLEEAGITLNPEWIQRGEDSAQTGAYGVADLMSLPAAARPTAVVCVSDLIAIGAMNAAAAAGLEPGRDVAIIGFDDVPMAEFLHPPLTTVRQPIPEIGEILMEMLLSQINDHPLPSKSVLLKPELMIRESG
jgi:DNA-binding LacI/PurR family transcriptional regulator